MTPTSKEVNEIQEYCIKHNISIFEYYEQQEEKKKAHPEKIVKEVVETFKGSEGLVALEKIVETVEETLTDEDIDHRTIANSPLKGIVSNILYDMAQKEKNKTIEKEGCNKKVKFPVRKTDLKKFLGINLTIASIDHVVGSLKPEYIRKNYKLNNNKLEDEDGKSYSIEGTKSWSGEQKRIAKEEKLCSLIQKEIIDPIIEQRTKVKEELTQVTDQMLEPTTSQKKEHVGFMITFKEVGDYFNFKNNKQSAFYRQLTEIKGAEIKATRESGVEITWENEEAKNKIDGVIKKIRNSTSPFIHKKLEIANIEIKDDAKEEKDKLRARKRELEQTLNTLSNKKVTYLALEGANFGSYLVIKELLESNNLRMEAVIPEYDYREANLMASVKKAYPELFPETQIILKDVNELILLDFPKSSGLEIKYLPEQGGDHVMSHGKRVLPLKEYHKLLKDLDQGKDKAGIAAKYNVTKTFLEAANNRYKGTFDIVFLDYYCGETPRRQLSLKKLTSRLSDEAIIAVTTNLAKRVSRGQDPRTLLEKQFDMLKDMEELEVLNYEVKDEYKDSKEPMGLIVYHVKKK